MMVGTLVLAAPVSVALLIRWLRFRRTGRPGNSLPIFLLGYAITIALSGLMILAGQWSRRTAEVEDYVLFVVIVTPLSYFVGFVCWLVLPMIKKYLPDATEGNHPQDLRWKSVARDARHRAIEECAEEAYEYAIENEAATAADRDRVERVATRLKEAILALGEIED